MQNLDPEGFSLDDTNRIRVDPSKTLKWMMRIVIAVLSAVVLWTVSDLNSQIQFARNIADQNDKRIIRLEKGDEGIALQLNRIENKLDKIIDAEIADKKKD